MGTVVNVIGNIGSWKSTAVRELGPALGAARFEEDYGANPYLDRFYESPSRWAFRSQLQFLTESGANDFRARQRDGISVLELGSYFVHAVMTSEMHAQGLVSDDEFAYMSALADALTAHLEPPAVIVWMQAPPTELLRRIACRGRAFEQGISESYLARITGRYELVVRDWRASPVLRVDTTEVDVRAAAGLEVVVERIRAALAQTSR